VFKHIMVPVDLAHEGRLDRALDVAADLAAHYGARVTYVGVTVPQPSSVAHNPEEFAEKLARFAAAAGRDARRRRAGQPSDRLA
jgi:nucleotide-binding universal stress UspA family protein